MRNLVIVGAALALAFTMFSNSLNPKEETPAEDQQTAQFEMESAATKDPEVLAAPANPFDMQRVATLPSGFSGSTSEGALTSTAQTLAEQVSTYSSKQTPEQYVAGVENIDDTLRGELLASSTESWPEVQKANVVVTGSSAGVDPIIREYNEDATLAVVEVVVKQTVSRPDGTSTAQTRSYQVHLVGSEQSDGNIAWVVGGFQKQ